MQSITMNVKPTVLIIGGPNGAGKTTISRAVIAETLGVAEFVNADVIAQGLSGFEPDRSAIKAGRIMLDRLTELAAQRANFAFESTMASRIFAPRLSAMAATGYQVVAIFVWLDSPELAVRRVSGRVKRGGHFVPDDIVRRRYERGIANFVNMYRPLADAWRVYNNSSFREPRIVAQAVRGEFQKVFDQAAFDRIEEIAHGVSGTWQDDS